MNDIERFGTLNPDLIDGKNYFSSLLTEAAADGLISAKKLQSIQAQLLDLLAENTIDFTKGKSSSVRTERAEAIMNSILYLLGLALKSFPSVNDACEALEKKSIKDLYQIGTKKIDVKMNTAILYSSLVLKTMINTDNYAYKTTFTGGIKSFFKMYDPKYGANRLEFSSDYPLCMPINGLTGIEYICKYLESAYYENCFCGLFSSENIKHMLRGAYPSTKGMIFNIFKTVLTASLVTALTSGDIFEPEPTEEDISVLTHKISKYGVYEMRTLFSEASKRLCRAYEIGNTAERKYIVRASESIAQEVFHSIRLGCPERVLTAAKED